jgi:hypothetical protein
VPEIDSLHIADPPELWQQLGFTVAGGTCRVSGVCLRLGAAGSGVTGWALRGAEGLRELPTDRPAACAPMAVPPHPNGVVALDHVVVATPDIARTTAALQAHGIPLRRTREAGSPGRPMTQAFFKLGAIVVEVVGPPAAGPGAASFWGLAFTVAALDATASYLGGRLRPSTPAVQPGRRIATLDRAAGSTVPIAFLSVSEAGPVSDRQ